MIDFFLKKTIFSKRFRFIEEKKYLYESAIDRKYIHTFQVEKFNEIWSDAIINIPFYKMWKRKYNLPEKIKQIEDLKNFPVLTKKDIQDNQNLIFKSLDKYSIISTGGSTGEPTQFPTSSEESLNSYSNHYLARGWWGIKPLDNILLLWGHSHLFGSGIKGKINQYKRLIFDWLINTKRLNAYNVSISTLKEYYKQLKSLNPSLIIGYTSVIFKIAKFIDENKLEIGNKSNLKGVVVTSETVTNYDIHLIEKVFKVPCIIEYGMAETGVIAYSKKTTTDIKLFWDSFIGLKDTNNILHITTINERVFPLINYKTNDIIESYDCTSILTIKKILGRKNDFLMVRIGMKLVEVHSEFFTHVLKSINSVMNFQILQRNDLSIVITYVSIYKLDIVNLFFNEFSKEFKEVDKTIFSFNRVEDIKKTVAGKTKWIEIEK